MELLDKIYSSKNYSVLVFEGFEMTGKSRLLSEVKSELIDSGLQAIDYRPDWEDALNENVVSRGNRYIPGISVVEFFSKLNDLEKVLLLDRWVAVSYVYQKMYNQSSDCKDFESLIKSAKKCTKQEDGLTGFIAAIFLTTAYV